MCLDNRYLLLHVIGQGGTSTVYLATDIKIQRTRAIKIIKKQEIQDDTLWEKEFQMMKKLHHPQLAEILDVIETETDICFVMEYVQGDTVKSLLEQGTKFTAQQSIDILLQVCDILQYLHQQEPAIVYQDLKPSNLILGQDGKITLIDFGTARECTKNKDKKEICWGTREYCAPEQKKRSCKADIRSDIYSLGIIFFEITNGEKFTRTAVEKEKDSINQIVEKCTREKPENRYQNIEEIIVELKRVQKLGSKNNHYQKTRRKAAAFLCGIGFLCLAGAEILYTQSERMVNRGYEVYYQKGKRGLSEKERIKNLQEAIYLNPWRGEGYLQLLKEYREKGFSKDDYKELLQFLETPGYEGIIKEECLKVSGRYEEFAYETGLACYFEWNGCGNKKYAVPWLEAADNRKKLEEKQLILTGSLLKIGKYYEDLEKLDNIFDKNKKYEEYWKDLCSLLELDTSIEVKELVEKEVLSQWIHHMGSFLKCGITKQEMEKSIEKITNENGSVTMLLNYYKELLERL